MPERHDAERREGVVIAVRPRRVQVRTEEATRWCDVRRGLLHGEREQRTPLVVGDRVRLFRSGGSDWSIESRLARGNRISRLGSLRPLREHVIAANVDQVLALQSVAQPAFNARGLDRFLALGESAGASCAICLNKCDLASAGDTERLVAPYRAIGYLVMPTCALFGDGLGQVQAFLAGRTTLLVGPSGSGKSTLLNRLIPGLELPTREVSASTGRGVHTTTRVDYLPLPGGGAVLDSPGLRSVQPWIEPHRLSGLFPEMRAKLAGCRFRDCHHQSEPGCAVRAAVEAGAIDPQRYDSYLRMLRGLESEQA